MARPVTSKESFAVNAKRKTFGGHRIHLPEALRPIAEYRMVIYSLLLIILMLVRPQGLFNFRSLSTKKIPSP